MYSTSVPQDFEAYFDNSTADSIACRDLMTRSWAFHKEIKDLNSFIAVLLFEWCCIEIRDKKCEKKWEKGDEKWEKRKSKVRNDK